MSESLPKKRVLVLHGWTQNGRILKQRLEPFCEECERRGIELVFLDGPHKVNVDDIIQAWARNPAFTQDLEHDLKDPKLKELLVESDPRTWWNYDRERTLALGHAETLDAVREVLEKQKFDGVFGFRWGFDFLVLNMTAAGHIMLPAELAVPLQGGALAAIISAVLERPTTYPSFIRDGKPIHPPLQFCICVCGFRLIDPATTRILTPSFKTPTVHIIGQKDTIVPMPRSQSLIDLSETKRVIKHEDAHVVPLTASWIAFYCDFIESPSLDIPAPAPTAGPVCLL